MNFDMRAFTAGCCRVASTAGEEAAVAEFVGRERDALGFETYAWDAAPDLLADHPSFRDDLDEAARAGLAAVGLPDPEPVGATYGVDSKHCVAAGVQTVLLGPGTITEAHYPDETVVWEEVERGQEAIAATVGAFAGGYSGVGAK